MLIEKTVKLHHVLEEVIDQNGYGPKLVERRVLKIWAKIHPYNQFAQAVSFQDGILDVGVSHSVWLAELHYQQKCIIQQLNQQLGRRVVKKIVTKISTKPIDKSIPVLPVDRTIADSDNRTTLGTDGQQEVAEVAVSEIQDPQCRQLLKQILLSAKSEENRTKTKTSKT